MDEILVAKEILDTYEDIVISNIIENKIFFLLKNNEYVLFLFSRNEKTSFPAILTKSEIAFCYPHFMQPEYQLIHDIQDQYGVVCLRESDTTIKYLLTYEEKIIDTIERLRHLLALTPLEIEKEFQKEFLFYWNSAASSTKAELYIGDIKSFSKMNSYISSDLKIRVIGSGIKLNDKDHERNGVKLWKFQHDTPFFYIPIIDNRRIVPPTARNKWSARNINQIINGREFCSISHDTFEQIKREQIKTKKVGLVFEMYVDGNSYAFCCVLTFKNSVMGSLYSKIVNSITAIEIAESKRLDFIHLCKLIGNDAALSNKRVLLIGCGSLGSYVAEDLVKAGFRNIDIYDGETLSNENVLRHRLNWLWAGCSKAVAMKHKLESIHPEVCVNAFSDSMDIDRLIKTANTFDLIIFTVGSSDVQLNLNCLLFEKKYDKPVIFSWLEAGGVYSHILYVDYHNKGCFECLYTDSNGDLVNNKVNHLSESENDKYVIRNGCGATRVAYGTEILLRTTSAILNIVNKIYRGDITGNSLINIDSSSVSNAGNTFLERKCACCGDRDN